MTTEDIIERFISEGMSAYKRTSQGSVEGRKLDRHEEVVIDGITFTYWREWSCYKVAEYIREKFPEIDVECNLDGNNSYLELSMTDEDQRRLNGSLYAYLKAI